MPVARSLHDGGSGHALEFVWNFLTEEVYVGGGGLTLGLLGVIVKLPNYLNWSYLVFCLWSDFCPELHITGHLSSKQRLKTVASPWSLS